MSRTPGIRAEQGLALDARFRKMVSTAMTPKELYSIDNFGFSYGTVVRAHKIVRDSLRERALDSGEVLKQQGSGFLADKKEGTFLWREWAQSARAMQDLGREASFSQDEATIRLSDVDRPIAVMVLSDWHWGSWGTDYKLLEQITDEILSIPNLYLVVVGDMEHQAIKMRGVVEVTDNIIRPKDQHSFTESWLDEMEDRILFATWDNHSVEREEVGSGTSVYQRIMSRRVVYFNGIGHADVIVGDQRYTIAASHTFRGRSMLNPCHSQQRYMRFEGTDREIAIAGDTHVPGILKYVDGARVRLAMNAGSIQTNSGYAKRYFSLATHPVMPIFTLDPKEHDFTPYWSIREWLSASSACP